MQYKLSLKNIITVLFFLLFASPVFAAHAIPGNVPSTTPLQPMDSVAAPSYQKNIQGQNGRAPLQVGDDQGSLPSGTALPESNESAQPEASPFTATGANTSSKIFFIILLVAVVVFAYVMISRKYGKK